MIINRKTRRRKQAKQLKQYPEMLKEITAAEYLVKTGKPFDENLSKCFISQRYFVQVWERPNVPVMISVCRTELNGHGRYKDDISWDNLQEIKNTIGYKDFDCVEIYPRECDVINVQNMRHLWVMPEILPYAWRVAHDKDKDK